MSVTKHTCSKSSSSEVKVNSVRSSEEHSMRRVAGAFLLGLSSLSIAVAAPSVEGLELVSSSRVDRTNFDFFYRVLIQGDTVPYSNVNVLVTSNNPKTLVIKPNVQLGNIEAEALSRTTDLLVIRHDRTVPFNVSSLNFALSGVRTERDIDSGLQFTSLAFLEASGRALHEGTFPIQTESPVVGTKLILRATILGAAESASYQIKNSLGAILSFGSLQKLDSNFPWFATEVQVPAVPFNIVVSAKSDSGAEASWNSPKQFTPAAFAVRLEPVRALLQKGETVTGNISLRSATASGPHEISVSLPVGFASSVTTTTTNLTPGSTVKIPFSLTAPTQGAPFQSSTVSVRVTSTGGGSSSVASLRFVVE